VVLPHRVWVGGSRCDCPCGRVSVGGVDMADLRQAAQQALEALDEMEYESEMPAIAALRAALEQPEQPYAEQARRIEQETHGRMRIDPVTGNVSIGTPTEHPEQEPVAICPNCLGTRRPHADDPDWRGRCDCTPPRREWRGLTEEEIKACEQKSIVDGALPFERRDMFASAIEQLLKEKNQ
jgi:hypothetical protein